MLYKRNPQLNKHGELIHLLSIEGLSKNGGRGNGGRITTRGQGGGHKKSYRLVDFRRTKHDVAAVVERLEYDPNRTAFIALIKYADGELAYILAPQRLAVGDSVIAGKSVDVKPGNAMPLASMPVGTIVHNVELKPGRGGQIARSAGDFPTALDHVRRALAIYEELGLKRYISNAHLQLAAILRVSGRLDEALARLRL